MERLNLVYVMSREQQDIELFNGRITEGEVPRSSSSTGCASKTSTSPSSAARKT
jgi:hypothetical protein